jgi:lipopolysaccharide/colanic/teichoic acid biosynthesis glycosyltransferase
MENNMLQSRQKPRTYKHFTFTPQPETAEKQRVEFLYIGKKSSNIDFLINSFDSGYAAESLPNAAGILNRILKQHGKCPDIIIIEGGFTQKQLVEFSSFMGTSEVLNSIPVFIDSFSWTRAELVSARSFFFVDDIVDLTSISQHKLLAKVTFWKKMKQKVVSYQPVQFDLSAERVTRHGSDLLKRIFDVTMSIALMIILIPVFLLIIIALRIEAKGPFFYISKRAGKGYRIFNFYKFRTMEVGSDEKMQFFSHLNQYNSSEQFPLFLKFNNDPRVTKVGMFLRNTSLDELPQLLNVLKGDMSLVGNRPLPLYEAEALTTDQWAKRFLAPAGMTGLWQIKKRGKHDMSTEERIKLDINYADKSNFLYDLWIMANTPPAIIQKSNV